MQTSLYDYCMERSKAALLTQWHPAKNGALTPQQIAYGSTRKVWWICAKGHIWQAAVNTRTANHTDCPYCAGRLPWPGETDLASQYQDLVKEWHPTRNLPLTPEQVLPGSEKKVWWKCVQGHEWQAEIRSRVSGCGCPVCQKPLCGPRGKRSGQPFSRFGYRVGLRSQRLADTPGRHLWDQTQGLVAL